MPPWLQEIIILILTSTTILGGIGWLFRTRLEDRRRAEDRRDRETQALEGRVERLYSKVESLLRDAVAREKEYNDERRERMEMDAQMKDVVSAATTALKETAAELSKHRPR